MEGEFVRSYIGRILEIFIGISCLGGTEEDDEAIWKILESLKSSFKQVSYMIQLVMPYNKYFAKETLLGRLEFVKVHLRQSKDLARVEIPFSSLNI